MKLSVRALWLSIVHDGMRARRARRRFACPVVTAPASPSDMARPQWWTAVDEAHPLPVAPRQDLALLASGNTAMAAQTVYGGDYLFGQSCTAYGTIALQVLAADGAASRRS